MKQNSKFILIAVVVAVFSVIIGVSDYVSSEIKEASEMAYQSGYDQALKDNESVYSESDLKEAYYDGFDDGVEEAFASGLTGTPTYDSRISDVDYVIQGILEEARYFASESSSDITLLDAMDIVSVYLDGYDPSGYPLPTKREFEEAVDVLLRYAIFLEWNTESYSSIMKDYDPFYG